MSLGSLLQGTPGDDSRRQTLKNKPGSSQASGLRNNGATRCYPKSYLVYFSSLGLLWLNGELHVNIDMTVSFSATVLVLYALLKR